MTEFWEKVQQKKYGKPSKVYWTIPIHCCLNQAAIKEALEHGETPTPPTHIQELFEVKLDFYSSWLYHNRFVFQEIHILIFVIMVMYICEAGKFNKKL